MLNAAVGGSRLREETENPTKEAVVTRGKLDLLEKEGVLLFKSGDG